MADSTDTTTPAPLTDAELKTLAALTDRQAAAKAAAEAKVRSDKLANLSDLDALVKIVNLDKVVPVIDTALNNQNIDFTIKQLLMNFKVALTYNIGTINDQLNALRNPVLGPLSVAPTTTPTTTA